MNVTKDSVIEFHALRSRPENEEETLIGRPDISNYIVLPNIGIEIIERLQSGQPIFEIEAIFEERFGEPVDVLSFVQDLIYDYQFIHKVDGAVVNEKTEWKDHLPFLTERLGNFFFNRFAFALYALLFFSGLVAAVVRTEYFPVYSDIFLSSSVTVSLVTAFLAGWFFLFLHEIAHLMAARSLGIGSRIGLSHRLVFMVAETNMSNIVLLPPQKRYRAFLAGMAWDGALFGVGVWLQVLHGAGWLALPEIVIAFLRMINLSFLLGLGFQFLFFMQTDVYYVFTARFNCKNLIHNTRLYLRGLRNRLDEAQQQEWEGVEEKEKRVIRWYAWFYLIGMVWALFLFSSVTLRQAADFISKTYDSMAGHPVHSWPFLDGVLLIALTLVPFSIVVWSWIRTWRERAWKMKQRDNLTT